MFERRALVNINYFSRLGANKLVGCRQNLYSEILKTENILSAFSEIKKRRGSYIAGPDGLTVKNLKDTEDVVRQVKLRLRKRKNVNSNNVETSGEKRKVLLLNLYDRIAQQAVYRQIFETLDKNMSKYSYGFRKGIGSKVAASKLANVIMLYTEASAVKIDFKNCFDNIRLDDAIDNARRLGIKDTKVLSLIKHLMWTSKEYNGVGLNQGTILGPILTNCYLDQIDKFVERFFDLETRDPNYTKGYKRHKGEWISWNVNRNKKIKIKYFRYADDIIFMCHNKEEQEYVNNIVRCFVKDNLNLEINEEKSTLQENKFEFLGYRFIKSWKGNKPNVWIKMKNEKEYIKKLKEFKFNSYQECVDFLRWIRGVLIYFDICNNLSNFLKAVDWRLYIRSIRKRALRKESENNYSFGKEGRGKVTVDIYSIRKATRVSFKEYLLNNFWIEERELLKNIPFEDEYRIYYYSLYTKQKGLDAVTKQRLRIGHMVIHHVIPRYKGGTNSIENLILIDENTHYAIHYGTSTDKRIKKYQSKL